MKHLLIVFAIMLTSAAMAEAAEHRHEGDNGHHPQSVLAAKGRESLTLIQVMHDLGANMNRLQWGLFTNNRYMVKEAAEAIASHPMPQGGLKPYVKKNADMIKDVVPEYDRLIHKTALQMKDVVATAPIQELHSMANKMAEGCISCHDLFRNP